MERFNSGGAPTGEAPTSEVPTSTPNYTQERLREIRAVEAAEKAALLLEADRVKRVALLHETTVAQAKVDEAREVFLERRNK